MKKLTKVLALVLAMATLFGVAAMAGDIPEGLDLDNLPAIVRGQTTSGSLEGDAYEVWYRFTAENAGLYRFTVDGAYYDVYFIVDYGDGDLFFSAPDKGMITDDIAYLSEGETQYVCVYRRHIDGDQDYTVLVEYSTFDLQATLAGMFGSLKSSFENSGGLVGLLASLGDIPFIMLSIAFFFLPFSMGGSLVLVPIALLMLPVTLLMSPFMLIQWIRDTFS